MALNRKQLHAVPHLVGCETVEEAARKAGIARGTLHGWLKNEEFQEAVHEARKRLLDRALHRLSNICLKAVNTLERLLSAESEAVARAAANDILGHALKHRELSEIEARLESVERIVLERKVYRQGGKP